MNEERTGEQVGVPSCYRHPERESYIRCQRCDRYVCPDCQREASVGVHCLECVREGNKQMPAARTRFGGVLRPGDALVTKILIGLNLAVFVPTLLLGSSFWGETAMIGAYVYHGEYWRLFTSMFVQAGLMHLAVNLISLWVLGPMLESALGRLRFVALYLIGGLGGSAVAYAFTELNVPVIGASGAIAALFGAILVLSRQLRLDPSMLFGILAINVVINVFARDHLSWQGHLGGLIAGALLGVVLGYAPRDRRTLVHGIGFAAVAALSIGLVAWRTGMVSAALGAVGS